MKTAPLLAITLAITLAATSAAPRAADDETAEPPLTFTLTIDGSEHVIEDGKPLALPGKFENPTVTLGAAKKRTFQYAGIKFDYPVGFAWEAESDANMKTWTLNGSDLIVVIFEPFVKADFDEMITMIKGQVGARGTKSETCKRMFGKEETAGQKFGVRALGARLVIEAYEIKTAKGSRLVLFQDSLDKGETQSDEAKTTVKMICESFSVAK